MNKLSFNNRIKKRIAADPMARWGDVNETIGSDVVFFQAEFRNETQNDGWLAKVISIIIFLMALPSTSWLTYSVAFSTAIIMFIGGHLSTLSGKRRAKRITENSERFGLFLTNQFLAWRDLDSFHFIPHHAIVSFQKTSSFMVVTYKLSSEKKQRELHLHTLEPTHKVFSQINQWILDKSDRYETEKEAQDMRDMSEWIGFLQKVQIYQDWLPDELLAATPSLPCTQQEIARFVTLCREYHSNFRTRDIVIRTFFYGSLLGGLVIAWLPLMTGILAQDGWQIMSGLGSMGIGLSFILNLFVFERTKDADPLVKHLFVVLLCTFFILTFMI